MRPHIYFKSPGTMVAAAKARPLKRNYFKVGSNFRIEASPDPSSKREILKEGRSR